MATAAQIKRIHAAAREVGLEREPLYDLVEQVSGKRSISRLTFAQAGAVIDLLVKAGARQGRGSAAPRRGRKTAANEVLLITPEQQELIADLRRQLDGKWAEERYYEGACMRLIKRPRPASAGHARRVIEMLKARLAHAATAAPR